MKQLFKKIFTLAALLCVVAVEANNVTPTLAYRSQGFHADRQRDVGMVGKINLDDMESWYGALDMSIGYMRSFRESKIARCLFGSDLICEDCCKNTILVQGSNVSNRDPKAWLADYLYLNCDYSGSFCISPRIQNVVVDIDFYLGLDEWVNGMYFRMYGPINWTKWQTRFCAINPDTVLTDSCSTGYFTPSGDEVFLDDLAKYFAGGSAGAPTSIDNITFQPLKFAKMPNCDHTQTGFADLRAEFGWNFVLDEDYHLGAALHIAAPTGNKRRAEFVMDPVVGNGNHWELGGAIHGHYVFWRSEGEDQHIGFYFDAVLTHMFRSDEQRTFDLNGKDNSRYMLATKFTRNVTNALAGRPTAGIAVAGSTRANFQFDNTYAPVANLTTTDVNVSVGLQADVVAMFNFTYKNFSWDLGYNFWGRTCEDIKCPLVCDPCNPDSIFLSKNANTWALKGDARMFGFAGAADGSLAEDEAQALSATQNEATIHGGTNATTVDATLTSVTRQNGGVDNSQFAIGGNASGNDARLIHTPIAQGGFNVDSDQIKTSIQPIFIERADVALQETRGQSHKIFTHFSYNWERDNWAPFIGVGGSAEFGKTESCKDQTVNCDPDTCGNCIDCALSQWSVWLKGGVAFN